MTVNRKKTLTIIAPCYNEALILREFWSLLSPVLASLRLRTDLKVLFVNNGSTDNTIEVLDDLRCTSQELEYLTLSRNFGYQGALDAGIRHCQSDLYCFIDADGEDPPELLMTFLSLVEDGAQIAYGIRTERKESSTRSNLRKFFYRGVFLISDDPFRVDTGEFSMFTDDVKRAALDENNSFPFLRASLARVGFSSVGVPHERNQRLGGKSRLNALAMLNFAVGGALSSSTYPLRLALYLLPLKLLVMLSFALAAVLLESMALIEIGIFLALVLIMVDLAFISVYLARTYKNGLMRPSAIGNYSRSSISRPNNETK